MYSGSVNYKTREEINIDKVKHLNDKEEKRLNLVEEKLFKKGYSEASFWPNIYSDLGEAKAQAREYLESDDIADVKIIPYKQYDYDDNRVYHDKYYHLILKKVK